MLLCAATLISRHTERRPEADGTFAQSESRLYTFSHETKEQLRKFRLGTSRAKTPMAKICKSESFACNVQSPHTKCVVTDQIDIKTQEIKPSSDETYTDMLELADDLPDSSPRYILLSYPLTLVC